MSINCGDIDNDGYLDLYFGTGWMSYSGLFPNVLLKNVDGRKFEDVTDSSRTGHLQKGHGVSFADWDGDGDLDLFTVLGGGFPGDRGYSALFENPGNAGHWLKVKLVGTRSNRAALGREFTQKSANRAACPGLSTAGSAPMAVSAATRSSSSSDWAAHRSVSRLTVIWPTSHTRQVFENVAAGQSIVITEGGASFKVLKQPAPVASQSGRQAALPDAKGSSSTRVSE